MKVRDSHLAAHIIVVAISIVLLAAVADAKTDGVTKTEIKIGIVTSMTGKVGDTGQHIVAGYRAAFQRANVGSGIGHGRKLTLDIYDDAYDPLQTLTITSAIIAKDEDFILTGYNGTATSLGALPLATRFKIPFLFPRSGDSGLRVKDKYAFIFRPSFTEEIDALIRYVVTTYRVKKFAILIQSDPFGESLRKASLEAMKKNFGLGSQFGAFASYAILERDNADPKLIKEAYDKISAGNPEVVIFAASHPLSAPFVQLAEKEGKLWKFLSVSSTAALIDRLADSDAEVIFSQVTPNPFEDQNDGLQKEYLADLKASGQSEFVSYTSFEAYICARIIVEAVKRVGADPTREKFIKALEGDSFQIGSFKAAWPPDDHSSNRRVYLAKGHRGKWTSVEPPALK
jgi:branched-chain amino acid transport system substrate-binding protein